MYIIITIISTISISISISSSPDGADFYASRSLEAHCNHTKKKKKNRGRGAGFPRKIFYQKCLSSSQCAVKKSLQVAITLLLSPEPGYGLAMDTISYRSLRPWERRRKRKMKRERGGEGGRGERASEREGRREGGRGREECKQLADTRESTEKCDFELFQGAPSNTTFLCPRKFDRRPG